MRQGYAAQAMTVAALVAAMFVQTVAAADKKYGPGVTDTEIKIGQTMPYSGPASSLSVSGTAEQAYFAMVNAEGGVNGRKVNLISLDDGYSPPRTVEQTRKLVESDNVLLIFQPLGTAANAAIQKYLNAKGIPHLFVGTGATRFNDPKHFPWTMGWSPNLAAEGKVYARHILASKPDAKIGILWQNDDLGKDYLAGFKEGLGDKAAAMIVREASFETSEPTIDSQILALKSSGADVLFNIATPKAAAQAMRKVHETGWKPVQFVIYSSSSIAAVMQPTGIDKVQGVISATYLKDPNDPAWQNDPATQKWREWMARYNPKGDPRDFLNVYGYTVSQLLVRVLAQCGDDLSRENVMRQVTNLDFDLPMLLPGIRVKTSPTDFRPIKQMQLQRFEGERWVPFGGIVDGG
ncbi:MAG: ABC transporter substrate-binding protein [Alphaproteobacteria bacterium]|nr:ABC transporter substrate-binding protein [Alphaproteobacteria bacterium]